MIDPAEARERAMAFLAAESDGLPRCCALVLAGQKMPSEALVLLAESERTADQPVQCQRILETLDNIGALGSQLAEQVCGRVAALQQKNGSWKGGNPADANEIVPTGMIAGYLAKTHFVRQRTLDSAADHLAMLWDPDRVKGDAFESTAAYFHCFSLIQHESGDAILQWCGRELQRGLVTGIYDAVRTARVFMWCRAHALPGAPLTRDELLERVVAEQCDDGGYRRSETDSVPVRVAHTLDALVGLVHLDTVAKR